MHTHILIHTVLVHIIHLNNITFILLQQFGFEATECRHTSLSTYVCYDDTCVGLAICTRWYSDGAADIPTGFLLPIAELM